MPLLPRALPATRPFNRHSRGRASHHPLLLLEAIVVIFLSSVVVLAQDPFVVNLGTGVERDNHAIPRAA